MLSTFIIGFCLHFFYHKHVTTHEPVIEAMPQIIRVVEHVNTTIITEPQWPCSAGAADHSVCILLLSLLSALVVLMTAAWAFSDFGLIVDGLDLYYNTLFAPLEPDSVFSAADISAAIASSDQYLSPAASPQMDGNDGMAIQALRAQSRLVKNRCRHFYSVYVQHHAVVRLFKYTRNAVGDESSARDPVGSHASPPWPCCSIAARCLDGWSID